VKKIIAVLATAFFAISVLSAPVMAGPGCGSLKGSKCALTGKTCTSVKKEVEKTSATTMSCANATLAIEGLKDTEKTKKMTKMLSATDGVYCVDHIDAETGKAVVCFDPAKIEAAKLAGVISEFGLKAKVLSSAEGHPADCTPEKMSACQKTCQKTCTGHGDKK